MSTARTARASADRARPDAPADPRSDPLVLRVTAAVLITVASVALAVVEAFLVPLRAGSVPLPLSVPLAVAGNVLLARLAARRTGGILAVALQPAAWLVTVVVLSLPRAEGDVIVEGTLTGLLFLFGGAVGGAYAVASELGRRVGPNVNRRGSVGADERGGSGNR